MQNSLGGLLRLAIPSTLFAVLTHGYRAVDQFWIQDVSTAAQAAIGSSTFVQILFFALALMISAGSGPLIARAVGANNPEEERELFGEALVGSTLMALIVMVGGGLGAPLITLALGLEGETGIACTQYLRALCWTIWPVMVTTTIDGALISRGNARLPMILHAITLLLNIALTPLLIYTLEMGVAGAALASNGARLVGVIIALYLMVGQIQLRWHHLGIQKQLRRIIKVGAPLSWGVVLYSGAYWGLLYTSISPLGPEVNAALGIGFSALEGITWPCFNGLSMAVSSFIGRNLGAQDREAAKAVIKRAFPIVTAMGVIAAGLFYFGRYYLTGLFTEDPQVHEAAALYAMLLAYSQIFVAWEALTEGVLSGAGDNRTIFWWSAPFNLLRIPLAYLLAHTLGWGAAGVWWAINITTYLKVFGKAWAVFRGKWAELEI